MKNTSLLIADDQDLIRESLQIVLNMDPDIQVVGLAENGRTAVELCESIKPDVVLMDIHMPEMNGVDATKHIKGRWPEIKVIILTTFQEVHYVVDALSAGAEGYLLKAINPSDLAAGIKWVSQGGSLIPQDIAKLLINGLNAQQSPVIGGGAKTAGHFGLSERELQVLSCISDGLHNKDIASKLFLSEGTVKNYISSIYSKLDVRDRVNAAKKAKENGLLS